LSLPQNLGQFATLVDIIAKLRAPDGCPWDRKQTHSSLRENLLEECYEVLEALDEGNSAKLCGELGDLLMQIILHAQIAAEAGEFEMGDVIKGINAKLIHRHPHIFGSLKVKNAEEVALNWEALKQEEREPGTSILDSVPGQMPALGYSQSIQRRVAGGWLLTGRVLTGLLISWWRRLASLSRRLTRRRGLRSLGIYYFTLANIARRLDIDLEQH